MDLYKLMKYHQNELIEHIDLIDERVRKEELLGEIMKIFHEKNMNSDNLRNVFLMFSSEKDMDDVVIFAAGSYLIDISDLKFFIESYDGISDIQTLLMRAKNFEVINYGLCVENLKEIFQQEPDIDYISKNSKKQSVENVRKSKNMQKFAEKPYWVSLQDGDSLIYLKTLDKEENYDVIETKEMIKNMIKSMSIDGENIDIDEAINVYMSVKAAEFSDIPDDSSVIKNRVFGPANFLYEDECASGGVCRMLECNCHMEGITDWFIGFCEECGLQIRDKSHVARIPLKEGGWVGCFCSFECIESSTVVDKILLSTVKDTLRRDGIMDRTLL